MKILVTCLKKQHGSFGKIIQFVQRKIHPNYFGVVALVVVVILQEKILTQYNFLIF